MDLLFRSIDLLRNENTELKVNGLERSKSVSKKILGIFTFDEGSSAFEDCFKDEVFNVVIFRVFE